MIFKKPDVIIKNFALKQVYLLDRWGLSLTDKVAIPVKSGRVRMFKIIHFTPILEGRADGQQKQAKIRGKLVWRASLAEINP